MNEGAMNMQIRKMIALALAAVLTLSAAAGCGKKKETEITTVTAQESVPAKAVSADPVDTSEEIPELTVVVTDGTGTEQVRVPANWQYMTGKKKNFAWHVTVWEKNHCITAG